MFGKTIKIFLPDGKPQGFKQVEIANWSGQALSFPRSRISELCEWKDESSKPGVYFLFAHASFNEKNEVYVGESEDVLNRLSQHNKDITKDFWNEAVIFTSKDENLTKGHIQYLESKLIQRSKEIGRYSVNNSTSPIKTNLPKSDIASMDEFIENIRTVLGSLGHQLLEPLASTRTKRENESSENLINETYSLNGMMLYLKKRTQNNDKKIEISATMEITDEGYVLKKGSYGASQCKKSASDKVSQHREELINKGLAYIDGEFLIISQDVIMSSPSKAASIIIGVNSNGLIEWKHENQRTLKKIEEERLLLIT